MFIPRSSLAFLGNRLEELENALLTFKISTGISGIDPGSGNPIESIQPFEVRAYLRQLKSSEIVPQPGVNSSVIYLKGRCVLPLQLPDTIKPLSCADATIDNYRGRFTLTDVIHSSTLAITQELGTKIAGYLTL